MRNCDFCSEVFEPTKPIRCEQRFCSSECRKGWHYQTAILPEAHCAVEPHEPVRDQGADPAQSVELAEGEDSQISCAGLTATRCSR